MVQTLLSPVSFFGMCCAPGRVLGCTTPARLQRPPGAFRTSCSEHQPPVWLNRSPAAPQRSASLTRTWKQRTREMKAAHLLPRSLSTPCFRLLALASMPPSKTHYHKKPFQPVSVTSMCCSQTSAESVCCVLRVHYNFFVSHRVQTPVQLQMVRGQKLKIWSSR